VIIAPAVAVRATGARVGIEGEYDSDLLLASATIGAVHGVIAWRRLVDEERAAERAIDVWLSSINALVVLAFCSTFLITGVLLGFTDIHALLAARGAPVVLLWGGVAIVAVVLAELTGHWVYRWLEPQHPVQSHHLLDVLTVDDPGAQERGADGARDGDTAMGPGAVGPVAERRVTERPVTEGPPADTVEEADDDADDARVEDQPPATACMIDTVAPEETGVSRPSMKRTSSSSTNTLT
jgi:hypothetical protein